MKDQIPPFYEFFNPILEILKNEKKLINRSNLKTNALEKISTNSNLTQDQKNLLIEKNRIGWAVSYLNMINYISNEKRRGYHEITKLGLENYPVNPKKVVKLVRQLSNEKGEKDEEIDFIEKF